jgi:hypothetical protein
VTDQAGTQRDRLLPWIAAVTARRDALPVELRPPVDLLIEQLAAIHRRDVPGLHRTLADDLQLGVWGWERARHWSFTGAAARTACSALLDRQGSGPGASPGTSPVSMRIDIDRFFPERDMIGFDGDWSCLRSGDELGGTAAGCDPAATYLVSRRCAWFATMREGVFSAIDVYWSVHTSVGIADRAPVRPIRPG